MMATKPLKHQHAEAFKLMKYRDTAGNEEIIWNSRDGVTPFIVTSRHGFEAQHVDWNKDTYAPDYAPKPGDRIFVDLTIDVAIEFARKRVAESWEHPKYPMREHGTFALLNKDEAAGYLARDYVGAGDQPHILEVTQEWIDEQIDYYRKTKEFAAKHDMTIEGVPVWIERLLSQ